MDTSSIYPRVKVIVADVLAIDESEVEPNGSLINDYGGESIDFLDLVYRLEREFKVKIPRGQIEKEARGALEDEAFAENGKLTPEGMAQLKEYLSEVPAERFKDSMSVAAIPTLFTVETFCKLVLRAQERQEQPASS
ncbi:MAG: acyl carrier protein [Acidobacteria bacterium]|nr:MAG: acyl carrier protein [Acidobacteriota bacterium]